MHVISAAAIRQGKDLGLTPDRLQEMARLAAPVTHDLGSHRYEDYVMSLDDGETIFGVWSIATELSGRILTMECPFCEKHDNALNCNHCGGTKKVSGSADTLISFLEEASK